MNKKIENAKIAIIGLGYVGLPLALEFSKKYSVIGFDLDEIRINEIKEGKDSTNEISNEDLTLLGQLKVSSSIESLKESNVYIITVPTPIDNDNMPDLAPLKNATKIISKVLSYQDVVIYESTVYPGCTEEICIPILEENSKLVFNSQFFCGYSPERINPGDKVHTLKNIIKITSGSNIETAEYVNSLYSSIIPAGTYKASSIAVAEAAKVIENTQRDVNIALINELSIIFNKLDLDTSQILEAASTKWNFLPFSPGLVGGHCIGVDPYYLTYKAIEIGYQPEMILAGRRINDTMGKFIAENTITELEKQGISPLKADVAILGLTFKENCPDLRNTKIITILNKLSNYKCRVSISDYWVDALKAKDQFNLDIVDLDDVVNQDAVIIAVAHEQYKNFTKIDFNRMLKPNGVLVDVKSLYKKGFLFENNIRHWRL
tara:strand:+ start:982 stop:2280 length:1299 start_codon:yes stop_codon:yes gene_type:complete